MKRYDELGEAGLADRPRTPQHSPRETSRAVVSKILYLRQNFYFGAGRIAAYLQRFHQIEIARSSVHRILVKNDMGRLPANQKHRPNRKRWKRYEKAQPGHRLQMDVKFLEPIPGTRKRLYQFTAIDDQEFYQLIDQNGISDDIHLFNEKVREWEDYYNYHRPHGALQGRTPFERFIEKSRADVLPGS